MPEDETMRVISGLAGAALLVLTAGSILRNVVIPRGLGSVLTRVLWRMLRQLLLLAARPFHSYEARRTRLGTGAAGPAGAHRHRGRARRAVPELGAAGRRRRREPRQLRGPDGLPLAPPVP